MTGLILAGVDPLIAIRYQIVVMHVLLAATALAALATARSAEHALFDHAHRLAPYSKRLAGEATKGKDSRDLRPLRLHVKTGSS
jgi:hypothetical protein